MATLQPYIVRQGDYLTKLAHLRGFSADQIWGMPENAKIREQRSDMDMLQPGDIVYLPIEEMRPRLGISVGTSNHYVALIPKKPINIKLQVGEEILVKEPYEILGLGPKPIKGETDDKGYVSARVAVHIREIEILLTKRDKTLRVYIGNMDPPNEDSGIRKRLTHLGYYQPSYIGAENYEGQDPKQLEAAVASFQAATKLPVTGKADKDTIDALIKANGS